MNEADATMTLTTAPATAPTCPFPLSALPTSLQRFCTGLASDHAVPVEVLAVMSLWALMRASVPGAHLRAPELEIPIGDSTDSLILVHQGATVRGTLLDHILQPVMDEQTALVDAYDHLDDNRLALSEAQLNRSIDQMLRTDRFPDPAHFDFLRIELDRIQAQRRPLLMLKDVSARQLEELMPRCLDSAPGVLLTDVQASTELLQRLAKMRPESTSGTTKHDLAATYGSRRVSPATTTMPLGSQVALLCCCEEQFASEAIIKWPWWIRSSLVLNIGSTVVEGPQRAATDVEPWHTLVRQALAPRLARAHSNWQLTPKAAEVLNAGVDTFVATQAAPPFAYSAGTMTGMCGRLALALHASVCSPGTVLPQETVECALALLRWLIEERASALRTCLATAQASKDAAAEATMLERIRRRGGGRIRRRDLFRLFGKQRIETQGPVLERLLQKDSIFLDDSGFVCISAPIDEASLTQRTY